MRDSLTEAGSSKVPRMVRPGDPMTCANGHTTGTLPSVPTRVTRAGWIVRCARCGWAAHLRPYFGDRPQDVCYVVEEDMSDDMRREFADFIEGRY